MKLTVGRDFRSIYQVDNYFDQYTFSISGFDEREDGLGFKQQCHHKKAVINSYLFTIIDLVDAIKRILGDVGRMGTRYHSLDFFLDDIRYTVFTYISYLSINQIKYNHVSFNGY